MRMMVTVVTDGRFAWQVQPFLSAKLAGSAVFA